MERLEQWELSAVNQVMQKYMRFQRAFSATELYFSYFW